MKHDTGRTGIHSLMALAFASILALVGAERAQAEWKPSKPVEFVIMAGAGGGADRLARLIQSIVEKKNFSPVPLIPINKGGGSGAEALRYLKDKQGDPHVIMATLNSYYTTPLRNPGIGVDISKFTPIARLAEDTFILWVNADAKISNVADYVAMVKKEKKKWVMGGTGKGQEDSLVTKMLEKAYGLSMTYVPFKGGGTVAKNLVGKHIHSSVNNPSEAIGFLEAGKVRPLASLTPDRIPALGNVPTFGELGHPELVYFMQRSVVAPGGISNDVRKFYTDLFRKVYQSEEWQTYCSKKALQCAWLTGNKLQSYFVDEKEKHRKMLINAGEINN